jgi:hypothetical protein
LKLHSLGIACALALSLASPAGAVPLPFDATLKLQISSFPTVTGNGSDTGDSAGVGGSASMPAGSIPMHMTAPLTPPLFSVIAGFGIGAPSQTGTVPLAPGSNKALSFGGVTGTMGLAANLYLLTGTSAQYLIAELPIGVIGQGGTAMWSYGGGLIMGIIVGNPYQLGTVTAMGALQGVPSTVMGTGFDNRTAGGIGTLQLVSPASIGLGAAGSLATLATLSITFVPEPTTMVLLGAGLAALAAGRRRFSSHTETGEPA